MVNFLKSRGSNYLSHMLGMASRLNRPPVGRLPHGKRRRQGAIAVSEISLESRTLLAAAIGFDYTTIASNLHPTERIFGSTDPDNAPFTIIRYGFGQVTSLTGLPTTSAGIAQASDLTFSFGSNDVNNPAEVLTLSAFDDGLGDGIANQTYTPDGVNDVPTITIFNAGTPVVTGNLLKVALDVNTSGTTTSTASNPSSFQITAAVGNDTSIFDELMAATNNTGIVEFTLSAFNYTGPWAGVGDAEVFSSTGTSINLIDPPGVQDDHGNGPGTATAWNRAAPINGVFEASLFDEQDYFAVQLQAGRQYTFQAHDAEEAADNYTYVYVADAADNTIAEGDPLPGSNGWTTSATVSTPSTGTYYVYVFNSGPPSGAYSVSQTSDIAVNGDDHPDDTETPWNRSSPIAGNIEIQNDVDWFEVSLTQGVEYVFRTNPGTLLDTVLAIYDSEFTLLDENDDDPNATQFEYHSQITFTPASSGIYYLAVSGYGSATPGLEEPFRVGSYTLEQVSEIAPTPDRPVINAASNPILANEQRPTITWQPAANAVEYDVFIAAVNTPGTPIVRVRTSSTSFTPNVDLGIGRLRVWVQGISAANVRGPWSLPVGIRIDTPVTIGLNPDQFHAQGPRPEFSWVDLAGATSYDVWVDNRLTGTSQVIRTTVGENMFTPLSDLNVGIYRYWVRGISADGFVAQWSSFAEIYVGPTHVSPVQPTFETAPTFEWTSLGGVASYDVWLQRNSSVIATPTGITGTTWSHGSALTPGDYRWWVRPTLPGGAKGPWSVMQQFNVGGIPTIQQPSAITATTNISWTPVTGAASYDVFIRRDFNGQAFIQQLNQTATNLNIATSLPGTYRIWVRTISSTAAVSNWSRPLSFVVAASGSSDTGEDTASFDTWQADHQLTVLGRHPLSFPMGTESNLDSTESTDTAADEDRPDSVNQADQASDWVQPDSAEQPASGELVPQATQSMTPESMTGQSNHSTDEDQVMADMDRLLMLLDA